MSDRTEKAHKALADAIELFESDTNVELRKRLVFLLDVAHTQALIAHAEATERIADYYAWLRQCYPLGYQPRYPAPQQVTPFHPWVGPATTTYSAPSGPKVGDDGLPAHRWGERTGLDHG